MKLTHLKLVPGVNNEELEMFFEGKDYPFGVNATVHYKKEGRYEGRVGTYHNLTEVHWRYNEDMAAQFPKSCPLGVALESDIHGTGGTRVLEDFDYVEIVPAKEKNEHW